MKVSWKPFLLRSNTPVEGVLKAKDTPENPRVGARLKQAGLSVGIDFTGKCDRFPNSVLAHRLMEWVEKKNGSAVQNRLAEGLFYMYFTAGLYPNVENLVKEAEKVGLDSEEVFFFLPFFGNKKKNKSCFVSFFQIFNQSKTQFHR